MDFYSAYGQGFVRVAACTMHTAIGEPSTNAESVLALARECHDDGAALAVFPELTLSGYSIEDILMQDALLDAVEDALLDIVRGLRSLENPERARAWAMRIAMRRAVSAPTPPPMARPPTIIVQVSGSETPATHSVVRIAMVMPIMPKRLPCCEVTGWDRPRSARTNSTAATR